jgi:hypothetical protein
MLNYLKKFSLEILPSVAATVIGAYIVNHYISKPATDAPTAAVVSPADARKDGKQAPQSAATKPANSSGDVASIPERGVTAKGISERAMIEKLAAERPAEVKPVESKSADAKPAEVKSAEAKATENKAAENKATETKAAEAADHWHHAAPTPHEKAVAKATPAPAENVAAAPPADEHRDANDLARAAIERLRNADGQHNTQEASRAPDAPRAVASPAIAPPQATASIRPLPPPITVSTPPVETPGPQGPGPYTASINNDDPNRPVPPADIPPPPPIDLRANASRLASHTHDVAQHMLSAARSMFHAVLPNSDADSQQPQQQSSSNSQFTD